MDRSSDRCCQDGGFKLIDVLLCEVLINNYQNGCMHRLDAEAGVIILFGKNLLPKQVAPTSPHRTIHEVTTETAARNTRRPMPNSRPQAPVAGSSDFVGKR